MWLAFSEKTKETKLAHNKELKQQDAEINSLRTSQAQLEDDLQALRDEEAETKILIQECEVKMNDDAATIAELQARMPKAEDLNWKNK